MWAFRGSRHRLGNPSAAGDTALDDLPSGYADHPCPIITILQETSFSNIVRD
jgi:hypothetical protein